MALPTLGVLDKDQLAKTVNTLNSGRQAAADSASSVLSTEDLAVLTAIAAALPAALGAGGGIKVDGSGTVLPVSLAALPAGTNNIGDVDVLSLPALPAGANNIGNVGVASIAAGDNNIGNVDVLTLPALAAGTNNIGDVDVLTVPADPFGTNADAASASGSISAKLRSMATALPTALGAGGGLKVDGSGTVLPVSLASVPSHAVTNAGTFAVQISAALPASTNNIGDVDVLTLPVLPAGTNNIGDVDVLTVPADPFGLNADAASLTGSISAKLKGISTALGITALDLGTGTAGSRTLRFFQDTAQWIGGAGAVTSATQRATLASDDPAVAVLGAQADAASATTSIKAALRAIATALGTTALDLGSGTGGSRTLRTILDSSQVASVLDCSTIVTRPADTTAYTANDAFANSTSAPTTGGFTFTNAAGVSGGGGMITDLMVVCAGATQYDGELVIFDGAVTAINDNAAFTLTDADALLELGRIPFSLIVKEGQAKAHVTGVNIGYRCVGSANLRFLIKITNAPTPVSADTLNFRIKGIRS